MQRSLALLFLSACWGRDIPYEGGTEGGDDSVPVATVCGEDVDRSGGFTVEGPTLDLGTGGRAAAGLCVQALDPTNALTGAEPEVLATAQVCDDGSYVVGPISSPPSIGMFIVVNDCEGAGDAVMKTATGIKAAQMTGLGPGDSLTVEAMSVTNEFLAVEQADLEATGWTGSLAENGYMAGHVEDAGGNPVAGAVVACGCGPSTYYEDGDGTDGIYTTGAVANTVTSVEGSGVFMIPGAPIFSYACEDGGAHTWESTLLGSLPAYAVYIRFTADE